MTPDGVRSLFALALDGFLRGALILAVTLVLARLARRRPPAERHRVLALGLLAALLVPFLPRLELRVLPAARAGSDSAGDATLELVLLAFTALGTALLLLRRLGAARDLARFEGESQAVEEPLWRALNAALAREAGLRPPPRLLVHDRAEGPATWGFRQARIVLPKEALRWSVPRRRAVLLHELAHVRRRDVLVQLGADLARALHWLDPLVWIAVRELRLERERACDDAVLHAGARPSGYAAFLLAFARRLKHSQLRLAAQALALFGRGRGRPELDARLEHLLDPGHAMQKRHPRAGLPVALLVLLALPIAALELVPAAPTAALTADGGASEPDEPASPPTSIRTPAAVPGEDDGDGPEVEVHPWTVRKEGERYEGLPSEATLRRICPVLTQAWLVEALASAAGRRPGLPTAADLAGIPGVPADELVRVIEDEVVRLLAGLGLSAPTGIAWRRIDLTPRSPRPPAPRRTPAAAAPAPAKSPAPAAVPAPPPVPRAEPARPATPGPSKRELGLPKIELVARTHANSRGPDGQAVFTPGACYNFLFATGEREPVLGNFDLQFSNWNGTPTVRVQLVTDDRSTLAELGPCDIAALTKSRRRLERYPTTPELEVPIRAGHAYLIHTRDTNLEHWTAIKVLALSAERVTLAYRVLLDESRPTPGFPRPPEVKRR